MIIFATVSFAASALTNAINVRYKPYNAINAETISPKYTLMPVKNDNSAWIGPRTINEATTRTFASKAVEPPQIAE